MMSLLSIAGMWDWFRKSLFAQIAMGLLAFAGVWKVNNVMVARKTISEVKETAKKDGRKRNEKSARIRDSINPGTAWKRLQRDYAGPR